MVDVIITKEKKKQFYQIMFEQRIESVYQPIVSLKDGYIFGYEALSRITLENCSFKTEELFCIGEKLQAVWELEEMCRKNSLKHASHKLPGTKLFINVDPNVIHDRKFKEGVTCKYLQKYGLKPSDIVFEITERTSIEDKITFRDTIKHYQKQHYEIAIDDFGSGYAGLNSICSTAPNYIKIDMMVVRDIDKDEIKRSLVESVVLFCESANIKLIAEGIETREELKTLIKLGVHYGQGYYIQKPISDLVDITIEKKEDILNLNKKYYKDQFTPSFFGRVATICKPKHCISPDAHGRDLFQLVEKNTEISEVSVVDHNNVLQGLLTRAHILELFGGQFGFNLHGKCKVNELMSTDFLVVDSKTSIETVSKMALARATSNIYDAVIVTENSKYLGVVTVKDLLETAITIQVSRAAQASPLTGLPGNVVIQERITHNLESPNQFAIIYLDIDNFKAYNDAYGFHNGDLMIKAVAKCVEECVTGNDLMGHIGGDDFVVITDYWMVKKLCQNIICCFEKEIKKLYAKQDWDNGFIISKNRQGKQEQFPIATLSIAVITNQFISFPNVEEFSKHLAVVKKRSKQTKGNSIVII